MQIPKFLLMFWVATLGLSTLQAQRVDTEEQAKARELLRQKMAELDAQQPAVQPQQTTQPVPEPAAPPKKTKVQKAAPRPAPIITPAPSQQFPARDLTGVPPLTPPAKTAPDAAATPAITPPPTVAAPPRPASAMRLEGATRLTPDAEAKAREELRRKMADLSPSESATQIATTPPAKSAVAGKKQKKQEQDVFATPAPTTAAESPGPTAVPSSISQKSAGPVTVQRSNPTVTGKNQKYVFDTPAPSARVDPPIPVAVTGSKSQKLAELLTLYRSDAITPEEYHKKRAEILAQP